MVADASIYSLIRPNTPLEGPLDQYGKMISLKSMIGNEQLNEMQRTKLSREMQQEENFRKHFEGATPEQMNAPDFLRGAMAADPARGIAFQKSMLEQQKAQAELFKTKLETGAKALELHRDQLANVNDPQAAAQWVKAAYDDPTLAPIAAHGGTLEQAIGRIPTDPTAFAEWKRNSSAGAAKLLELNQQLAGQKETARHNAATEGQSAATLAETVRGHNMTDVRQRELNGIMEGQTSEPSQALVKAIATGEMDLKPPPTNARNPMMLDRYGKILEAVKKENPNWSAEMHPTIKKTVAAFAAGKEGQTIKALNTATDHLETLKELAEALKNGNVQLFNKIANQYASVTGNPAPSNLSVAAQVIGGEIVKGIVGAGGGVGERERAEGAFSNVKSPADMEGAINTVTKLMGGQFKGMKQQYEAGTYGRKDFADKYLTPAARKALDAATGSAASPAGTPNALPKTSGGIKFLGWEK